MKIINASFFIKADKREEFLADTLPLIRSPRAESGNISYQLYEAIDTPNQFVMVEEWQDQIAIDQHNSNPLLIQLLENLKMYSSAEPIIKVTEG
ncbi:putative quinol monooxygenase [Streptococcus mutans]|uniref:putative quinol monooxygenase n=1 Tax=Streptococcus mutans TaxID=1309 RepID=UPI0002E0FEF4|nr:putative quinol monooxygenase [Streptococcus mutans]NLQ55303.1 antibiotic biosynthesis monooxygenase [Streptococcus mutans]